MWYNCSQSGPGENTKYDKREETESIIQLLICQKTDETSPIL